MRFIGDLYASGRLVDVWCKDWKDTLQDVVDRYKSLVPDRIVAYLDPPYWKKSEKLYRQSFDPTGGYVVRRSPLEQNDWLGGMTHYLLAEYLRKRAQLRWILSYDDHPELTQDQALYAACRMDPDPDDRTHLGVRRWYISKRLVDLRYSASSVSAYRGKRDELLITALPPSRVPLTGRFRPLSGEIPPTGNDMSESQTSLIGAGIRWPASAPGSSRLAAGMPSARTWTLLAS